MPADLIAHVAADVLAFFDTAREAALGPLGTQSASPLTKVHRPSARMAGEAISTPGFDPGPTRVAQVASFRRHSYARLSVSYASSVFNAASMNALSAGFTPSPAACPQIAGIGRNSAFGICATSS